MTGVRDVRIDRLVLPASERHRVGAFRAALERSLAVQLGGTTDVGGALSHPAADRAARAVAARVRGQQP